MECISKHTKDQRAESVRHTKWEKKEKKTSTAAAAVAAKQSNNPLSFSCAFSTLSRALIRGRQHRNALEIIDMVTARELITWFISLNKSGECIGGVENQFTTLVQLDSVWSGCFSSKRLDSSGAIPQFLLGYNKNSIGFYRLHRIAMKRQAQNLSTESNASVPHCLCALLLKSQKEFPHKNSLVYHFLWHVYFDEMKQKNAVL